MVGVKRCWVWNDRRTPPPPDRYDREVRNRDVLARLVTIGAGGVRPGQPGISGPAEASGQNHPHQAHRHQQGAPLSQDLPPQGEGGGRVRRTHSHSPSPSLAPLLYPLPTATRSPATQCPPGQKEWRGSRNWAGGKGRTREVTGQGRPRLPKTVQSAEGEEGKEKRERIIVVVRSPCQENCPADAHPSAHKSVLESANPAWTRSVHLDAPGQQHGQQPGDSRPQSSQTGQVIQGLH